MSNRKIINAGIAPDGVQSVSDGLTDHRAGIDALRAENARLRAALEEAPEPLVVSSGRGPYCTNTYGDSAYADWYATTRREALDGKKS